MLRTLYSRLALALIVILFTIGIVYALLGLFMTRHYQQEVSQNLNRDLASHLIIDRKLLHDGMLDQEAIKQTFMHYMMVNPSIEIYLLDGNGKILSYSAEPGKVKRGRVALGPIREFLDGDTFPLFGDDPRSYERQKIFSVAPIPFPNGLQGYLYVVLRGEEVERAEQFLLDDFIFRLSGSALVVCLVAGLLAGLIVFRLLTKRLQGLVMLMTNFWTSNFSLHVPYHLTHEERDEIDILGKNFNLMADRIINQLKVLKHQDQLRRELVANVSHDLRTPLATMRGYLETLQLKGRMLSQDEKEQYLDTALRHSERLTRLVEDLFELARLDANEIKPHFEAFAPAELAQDVLQKFRLQADDRQISLKLDIDEGLPLVRADISLIERVLENLIANALRYTQQGDEIRLVLSNRKGSVEIQIKDTGTGINEEELPYIFERFYQADNKHRSGSGAGLGLAISQQILKLHESRIDVSSVVNEGTVFRFDLPAAA